MIKRQLNRTKVSQQQNLNTWLCLWQFCWRFMTLVICPVVCITLKPCKNYTKIYWFSDAEYLLNHLRQLRQEFFVEVITSARHIYLEGRKSVRKSRRCSTYICILTWVRKSYLEMKDIERACKRNFNSSMTSYYLH